MQHFATADGPSAMGVETVAQGLHLLHVRFADALVATFVEEDAGVVSVIDDGIGHHADALFPLASRSVLLGVAGRHRLGQADAVARLDVLTPRHRVHPTNQVSAALDHEVVAVVAQPGRHIGAHAGPLVRRALRIAVNHHHAVVQSQQSVGAELRLSEARHGGHTVDDGAVGHERRRDVVEVGLAPCPELQGQALAGGEHLGGAGGDNYAAGREGGDAFAVHFADRHAEFHLLCLPAVVLHLRLHDHGGFALRQVEVGGIDIHPRCSERGIEGQRLVQRSDDVQPYVAAQSAVVGVEVLVVPLESRARLLLPIVPAVVGEHLEMVFAFIFYIRCQVETERRDAVFVQSDIVAVEPHTGRLADTFKLDEHALSLCLRRQGERLGVAHRVGGHLGVVHAKGRVLVPGTGQGDVGQHAVAPQEGPSLVEGDGMLGREARCPTEQDRQEQEPDWGGVG